MGRESTKGWVGHPSPDKSGMDHQVTDPGNIVILNGASRAGKSSIVAAIQETLNGVWMNIGMDSHIMATPVPYKPGVGLRPGRAQVAFDVERQVPVLYSALYESIAAHARLGLNVAVDVKHHNVYTQDWNILPDCAVRLAGLPVLFVGVHCPIEEIWKRRQATWGQIEAEADDGVKFATEISQTACHIWPYDLEVDTSTLNPVECARIIGERLDQGPPGTAFHALAAQPD